MKKIFKFSTYLINSECKILIKYIMLNLKSMFATLPEAIFAHDENRSTMSSMNANFFKMFPIAISADLGTIPFILSHISETHFPTVSGPIVFFFANRSSADPSTKYIFVHFDIWQVLFPGWTIWPFQFLPYSTCSCLLDSFQAFSRPTFDQLLTSR